MKKFSSIISSFKKFKNIEKKKKIELSKSEFFNLINISLGYYFPLKGFCNYQNYLSIIKKQELKNKKRWSIPILLSVTNKNFQIDKNYILTFKKKNVGIINSEGTFKIDKKNYCINLFNTYSKSHPSVKNLFKRKKNFYLGGKVFLLKSKIPKNKYFINNFKKQDFRVTENSCVFSTRNICHVGHQAIHEKILSKNKKLVICIIENDDNKYKIENLLRSYELLKKKHHLYKKVKIIKIFLPSFFAGPKEAHLQAILFRNIGFKYFFIGRDHAGFKNYFSKYAAQRYLNKFAKLGIKFIKTKEPLLCNKCEKVGFDGSKICQCISKTRKLTIDGTKVKIFLKRKKFNKVRKYLSPLILDYCIKNINFIESN